MSRGNIESASSSRFFGGSPPHHLEVSAESAAKRRGTETIVTRRKAEPPSVDAVDLIARDIQAGVLAPGMWLKQIDLERRYRCSRSNIRRCLERLAEKRLVQHIPNRGYHVFEPDGRQTNEIRDIRLILEIGAVERIVANADPIAAGRLEKLARRFDDLILSGTLLALYDANIDFHRALLELSGNRELVNLADELRRHTSSAPASQWRTRARIEQSAREHYQMVGAVRARNAAKLKRVIAVHIRQSELIDVTRDQALPLKGGTIRAERTPRS
jgi:DNA-binding GntR family transcriptional regulator